MGSRQATGIRNVRIVSRTPSANEVFSENDRPQQLCGKFHSHSQGFHQRHLRRAARRQGAAQNADEAGKHHSIEKNFRRDAKVEEHLAEGGEVGRSG